ncbi:MAG: PAS-domain containing protein [Enhydrobacter sp.]|nr:MAG: PAS-domain containing protein [Enhydrobacter sp.]
MDDANVFADFARTGVDWLWETDSDDRYSYFSVAVTAGGIDLANRIGMRRADVAVNDPENARRIAELSEIVRRRQPFRDFLFRTRLRDGGGRWCVVSGEPRHDADGAFLGYRGIGRDVTDEVEVRRKLEVQGRTLEAILSTMPDGVQVVDENNRTLAVNDQIFEIMGIANRKGRPEPEITMQSIVDMAKRGEYGPGDPESIARERVQSMLGVLREKGSVNYQRQLKTGRWMEARLRAIDGGGFLSLYRDITESKDREAELERTSSLLQAIFENFPGGIAVYDRDKRLVLWNERYADIIGADPAAIRKGVSPLEVLVSQARLGEFGPTDDPARTARERWEAMDSGRIDFVTRERPNGRAFEMRRQDLPDGGSLSIYLDTTEQKRVERALQEANAGLERRIAERTAELADRERFLRNIVGDLPGMVYRCRNDRDWTMLFASEGCHDLFGRFPEELTSGAVTIGSLIHPDERDAVWEKVQADFRAGDNFQLEYRVRHADGTWRWVQDRARAIRSETGEVVMIEGLVLDIDARKQAEQQLAKMHETLFDAVQSVNDNLIIYDRDDRLVLSTRHLAEQYPNAERYFEAGRKFEDILRDVVYSGGLPVPPGTDPEALIAERVELHRRADGTQIVRHLQNGRILHISEHRSQSGGIVSIGRDVTDQIKMEAQLRESQRMEAIGKLTGGLAHDLNNYLAVIMGNLDMLADRPHSDPETPKLIGGALAGVRRGAELTRSLLAFSRRQPLDPRVLDLDARIVAVGRLIERTIGEKISLEVDVAPDLWLVRIDGAQLDAALVNLANNARDAMPNGGVLRIAVRNAPEGTLQAPAGDHVLIEVSDTGIGMAPDTMAMAFEPFFTTKGPGHGTGLGLSMVHGFVHQSGGVVRLESTRGRGTTVRLFLPRTREPRPATTGPKSRSALPGGNERILVVEDNEYVRETVVEQLVSLGYSVGEAESGDTALAMLETRAAEFDLIFTDLVMPGATDGSALAKLIERRWPDVAVLLTSGFSGEDLDTDDSRTVLRKPYRKADLAHAVRAALEKRNV